MIKLHHYTLSSASRFARLALGEYRVAVALIDEKPWVRQDAFLKLNPAGGLPVLVENDGPPVCGPAPIMEYLDETRGYAMGDRRLMPDHPNARAEMRRLCEWFFLKCEAEVTEFLVWEKVIKRESSKGAPDTGVMRAARVNMKTHLTYLDHLLSERNWVAGDRLSYADLAAAAHVSCLDYLDEMNWAAHGNTRDWYARIKSRPCFRPVLADKVLSLPPSKTYADLDF